MWLIVLNNRAGRGKARKLSTELISLLEKENQVYKIIDTTSAIETNQLLEKELGSSNYQKLVAVGGDGLVNICLQYVAEKPIGLTVIPSGTGNDFARAIGTYRRSVSEIYDVVKESNFDKLDLGKVSGHFGERWYVQVLSTGFDALVNSLSNKIRWPRGQLKYTVSTLLTLTHFKPITYEIDLDGKQMRMQAMLLAVANGQTYGGGMRICPDASNSDGYFDVFIVKPVSRIVLMTIFPKVFFGKHIPHPEIEILKAKTVRISALTIAHADGEFVSELPVEILNVPRSLCTWLMK
jgi:diacylglycerol kinase (ATP)